VIAPGGTGTITGNLQVGGLPGEGRAVDLEARPQGEEAFTPIGTATADDRGRLRIRIQPAVTTSYRWHYAGDVDARARVSGVVQVRVRTTGQPTKRRPTTLSALAVRGVVLAGHKDVVRAQLRSDSKRLAKRQVVLLARPVGQRSWRFRTSHRTGRMGLVSFTVRPQVGTEYRAAFAGTKELRPSTSPVVTVDVRPTLTITAAPIRVVRGGTTTITGVITHAGSAVAGAGVDLLGRRPAANGQWSVVASTTSAADGTITFAVQPEATTRYRLRARPAGGLPRGVSRVVEVQVVD
jgi:hypothetical protein